MKAFLVALFVSLSLSACVTTLSRGNVVASETVYRKVCDQNGLNCQESYREVVVTAQPIPVVTNDRNLQPPVRTTIIFETYNQPAPTFYGSAVYGSGCCYAPRPDDKWWRMHLP